MNYNPEKHHRRSIRFKGYDYAPVGERFCTLKSGRRQGRIHMIAGYRAGELIAPFTVEGTCNRSVFETWLETCLMPALRPGEWVIVDNATFHHGGRVAELIAAAPVSVAVSAPYSPDFNRIDKCWAGLKSRRKQAVTPIGQFTDCHGIRSQASCVLAYMNIAILDFSMKNLGGELAALGAALLWALSAVIYAQLGQKIPPLILNLSKGVIAIALIALTLVVQGNVSTNMPSIALSLLLLSGVLGIGLGDTFYFEALNNLGARRTLLLQALAPPIAALIALICLQETLSYVAWAGIFLTGMGVTWVISERVPTVVGKSANPLRGICFGMLSTLGQASGAVLARAAFTQTTISPLWSTLLRLVGGLLILLLWMPLQQQPRLWFKPLQSTRLLGIIALTALFSTYIGIFLQQTALKYAPAGIAEALISTSPLFVLPIAIVMNETVSLRAFLGVLVALVGIGLLLGWH